MKKLLIILTLCTMLFVCVSCTKDPVSIVQNGYLGEYTNLTVQEILDGHYDMFYRTKVWDGGTTDSGEEIVQVHYSDNIFETDDTVTIQCKVYNNNIFKITAFLDPDYEITQAGGLSAVLNYLYIEQLAVSNPELASDEQALSLFLDHLKTISGSAVLYGSAADYSGDRSKLHENFQETALDLNVIELLDLMELMPMEDFDAFFNNAEICSTDNNTLLNQENARNTEDKKACLDSFTPQIDILSGIFYDELTNTHVEIESFCSPGARALYAYYMTIHTRADSGEEIVFRDVPAYYANSSFGEGCIVVSLGAYYTEYDGIILVECEMADIIYYNIRSDINGCTDTENAIHSLKNITQAADLPRYTSYVTDNDSAMSLILTSYPNETFSELDIFLTPDEAETSLVNLLGKTWYDWETGDTWKMYDTHIDYQIVAVYNHNEMAYTVWYYRTYFPKQLCYVSIPLQVGDPWWSIQVCEPNMDGNMATNYYWNMSETEKQDIIAEEQRSSITEQDIIDKVYTKAVNELRKKAGGGVESLYHSATLDDSYVEYDTETDSYICLLNITYSTNIFDVFGTSKSQYAVSAALVYTGTEWVIAYYEIM